MATKSTTPGKVLLKRIIPSEYHAFLEEAPLDKGRMRELMRMLSISHPTKYRQILQDMSDLGEEVSATYGGVSSLTPSSFLGSPELSAARAKLAQDVSAIREDPNLSVEEKDVRITELLTEAREAIKDAVRESIEGTSLGLQLTSGTRGNLDQALDLIAGTIVPIDSDGNPMPLPIDRGFAEGLTPSQYWATAQQARMGLIGVKLATPEAGDLSNQLVDAVQRLRVTQAKEPRKMIGIPVDPADPDYGGSILSEDIPGIAKAGDILTPRLVRKLKGRRKKVLIHSPITSQAEYGISRESAGSALGQPFPLGSFAGITATQAISEPFTQASISSKHVGQRRATGIDLLKQLIEAPMNFPNEAAIAEEDGIVGEVDELATGGKVIRIGSKAYVVSPGIDVTVKPGDRVERGQIISKGTPNPRELTRLRGIGPGRLEFARVFSKALEDSGIPHNKRNVEYIARGLINHVRMNRPHQEWLPGDIVEFSEVERRWKPRESAKTLSPNRAVGQYVEDPIAYLTLGTRLTKSMAKDLKDLGVKEVLVSPQAPPFEPEMRRARESLQHSSDWLTRLGGSNLKRSISKALFAGTAPSKPTEPTAVVPQLLLHGAPERIEPKRR